MVAHPFCRQVAPVVVRPPRELRTVCDVDCGRGQRSSLARRPGTVRTTRPKGRTNLMRHGRLITAALAAFAAMAIAPAWAAAAPASFVDDSAAEFNAGTLDVDVCGGRSLARCGWRREDVRRQPVCRASLTATPSGATVAGGLRQRGRRSSAAGRSPRPGLDVRRDLLRRAVRARRLRRLVRRRRAVGDLQHRRQRPVWRTHRRRADRARRSSTPISAADPTDAAQLPHRVVRNGGAATSSTTLDSGRTTPLRLRARCASPSATRTPTAGQCPCTRLASCRDTFQSRCTTRVMAHAAWTHADADVTTPAGTAVTIETRSGATATPDGSWSP